MNKHELKYHRCITCGRQIENKPGSSQFCGNCVSTHSQICCINCRHVVTFLIGVKDNQACLECQAKDYIHKMSKEDIKRIGDLIKSQKPIEAIMKTRELLRISLKDARNVIDTLSKEN